MTIAVITEGIQGLRPIPGFPDYYISKAGRVFSGRHAPKNLPNQLRELKCQRRKSGHFMVTLFARDKRFHAHVHRLVALAFIGPQPDGKPIVRHIDGDEANNDPANLMWGTKADNGHDMRRLGEAACGERCARSKLNADSVRTIRVLKANGAPRAELARRFGIWPTTVDAIVERKTWRHLT